MALAGAAVLASVNVAHAEVFWSMVASACLPEAKAIQSNLYINPTDFSVGLAAGKTKPVVLICPVERKSGPLMPDSLGLSYKDSTGTGTGASVKATLVSVDRASGARATITEVSSNSGSGAGPAYVATIPFVHPIQFDSYDYYVRLDIARSATGQDVRAIGVSLETNCGDGIITASEECDDTANSNGDGCSSFCLVENGFQCQDEPSVCSEVQICGDSFVTGTEDCDDGDMQDGDGCSSSCTVENGASCNGEPSNCQAIQCGDNIRAVAEQCDGTDLGGASCSTATGGTSPNGTLSCNACVFDTSGCTP